MPIFEYKCCDCGTQFEVLAPSRSRKPETPECPECGRSNTGGILSACAIGKSTDSGAACDVSAGRG